MNPSENPDIKPSDEPTAAPAVPEKKRRRFFRRKKDAQETADTPVLEIPELKGPVLQRTLWREWRRSTLLFCLISVYLELVLQLCVFKSLDSTVRYPILFSIIAAVFFSTICTALPRIPGRILTILLTLAQTILAEVQLVYYSIFGNFMPLSSIGMGDQVVSNFWKQMLYGILREVGHILLLLIPLVVLIVLLILRRAPRRRVSWRQSLGSVCLLFALCVLLSGLVMSNAEEPFSVYQVLTNVNTSTDTSYRNIGMLATTTQEVRYMLLDVDRSATELSESSMGRTDEPRTYSSREYNVLDIDFSELAASTDDTDLQDLDNFFATVVPSRKNDYTGLLEGYNLITICAESFSPYLIDEELTPALYKLSHNGIIFENYYGTFQSVTTNGEYTMCMGLYPDMTRSKTQSSFDVSASNYVPFCLGNELTKEGYSCWAYHGYLGDFYNRCLTHPNMGYTFKAADSGLDMTVDWPSSDLEMMEASIGDYIDSGEPFHAYYMTYSGHYQYNWENAMSAKNRDKVEDLDYSDTVKAYIACNLELEYALEYLMDQLEEAGIADKTVIVLTNDHYPYGLTEEEYNELAGEEVDTVYERYRNSFICYVPGLKNNIYCENYCSTADILPTLLNLFGVDYDSRLLAGRDVLAPGTHMAILSDQSFLTDDFRFDASADAVTVTTDGYEVTDEELENYRLYVSDKFALSAQILNTNYYSHVFGVDSSSTSSLEDTIQFSDIEGIYNQANVLFMYRNGFVDPETEDTFGGSSAALIGEYLETLYRMSGSPEVEETVPDGYRMPDEECTWTDAVLWGYQNGLVTPDDHQWEWDDRVDFRTACIIMRRYAALMGADISVDQATVDSLCDDYSRLSEETVSAFVWCDDTEITTHNVTLDQLLDNYSSDINRYAMVAFLQYEYRVLFDDDQ